MRIISLHRWKELQITPRSLISFAISFALVMVLLSGLALAQAITLSGTATQGTGIYGATVTAYAVSPADGASGATLGSTTTGSDGSFAVSLTAPASPVRLTASGGGFVSPANGATIATPSDVSVLLADVTGSVSGISINPLADFVNSQTIGRLTHTGADLPDALTAATSMIEKIYQLQSDPSTLIPDYSLNSVGTAAGNLALVLGALAVEDQYLCPTAPGGLVTALSADIGDNAFDGSNFRTPIAYCGGDLAAISGISAFQDALSGLNQIQLVTNAFIFGGPGNLLSANTGYLPAGAFKAVTGIDSQMVRAAPRSINQFAPVPSTAEMTVARNFATATLLPNGKVLIAGGGDGSGHSFSSTDLYDPVGNSFAAGPVMNEARESATATVLPNGRVLIAGGLSTNGVTASTELYDPVSNSFATSTPSMNVGRYQATATLLSNGKVLIAGGAGDTGAAWASTDLFDPLTNSFTTITPSMSVGRVGAVAALLPGNRVLIAGGGTATGNGLSGVLSGSDVYDPVGNSFVIGPSMTEARAGATATLLANGKVLIAGGGNSNTVPSVATTELYDPVANRFTVGPSMNAARNSASAILLPSGKVLIVAGGNEVVIDGRVHGTMDLYDPATESFTENVPTMSAPRDYSTATLLPNGKVLVAGGDDFYGDPLNSTQLYWP